MSTQTSNKSSSWRKTKESSKKWFDKVGGPVNKVTNKLGAEAFWPTSLEKESDKAARILRSFSIDGFYAEQGGTHSHSDKLEKKLERIPPQVIQNCRGLAIFTVMRTGFHWSGAGGSGIIVARLPNGQWSSPSGILIHTLGWGLVAGADIYDCVCVINDEKGMEGFTKVRCTLGAEVSAAVGPLGGGNQLESEIAKRRAPVWTYTKGRGLYVGVQVDGTVIVERSSENERFYGVEGVKNKQILAGQVQPPPGSMVQLWETLQAVEGNKYDESRVPQTGMSPGDHELEKPQEGSHKEFDEFGHHEEERMDRK